MKTLLLKTLSKSPVILNSADADSFEEKQVLSSLLSMDSNWIKLYKLSLSIQNDFSVSAARLENMYWRIPSAAQNIKNETLAPEISVTSGETESAMKSNNFPYKSPQHICDNCATDNVKLG